jgi:predicted Zn-dependent protease
VHEPERTALRAHLGFAGELDALYETDRAIAELEIVLSAGTDAVSESARDKAEEMIEAARQRMSDEAYRLSIDGWRALERDALEEAEPALARALMLAPDDPVTRYRYARLLDRRGQAARAQEEMESVMNASPPAPAFIRSAAIVAVARAIEAAGDRVRALPLYQQAIAVSGGDLFARDEARRAIRRLQSPTKK